MSVDRWAEIERLYHDVLEHAPDERDAFLDAACAGDPTLRGEITSLLALEPDAERFLEESAFEAEARQVAADSRTMIGRQVDSYRIMSLIGRGGMGEVYLARDLRLHRDVALKVLVEELAGDAEYARRFENEARSASRLNHPNIVTIYGVGEHQGVAYIAMELVEGRTLRELLAEGAFDLATSLQSAAQLSDALASAHGVGLVHRDLKPENVMQTPARLIKVLDFGIARCTREPATSFDPARGVDAPTGVTTAGTIVGTAGYMSPEQAAGQPVGPPCDQFSFGAILYEMLTGRRAFAQPTTGATLAAILHETPVPIGTLNPAVPRSLRRIVERTLNKDPDARYAETTELAADVRRARDDWERAQLPRFTRRQAIGLAAAAGATLAVGTAGWTFVAPRDRGIRVLAVLPFVNVSGGEAAEYLSEGITEGLIRRLSLPSLKVIARTSVAGFNAASLDVPAIGRRLRADAVISGSIAAANGRLRISAALLQVSTRAELWTSTFERAQSDLLVVQEEMVSAIVAEGMRARLSDADRRALARPLTRDGGAYDLYLQALHLTQRNTEADDLDGQVLLRQALARDSGFAEAYAALATTYSLLGVDGYMRPNEAFSEGVTNARKAMAIDPDLPRAHAELAASTCWFNWDWSGAEREWEIAMQARHGGFQPDFLIGFALEQWALGRPQRAVAIAQHVRTIDPLGREWALKHADFLLASENFAEAEAIYHDLSTPVSDGGAQFGLAEIRRRQGRVDEGLRVLGDAYGAIGQAELQALCANVHGAPGWRQVERAAARDQLDALRQRAADGKYVSPLDLARSYAQLGDRRRALEHLPAAFADRAAGLVFLNVDRVWDDYRQEPIFREAIRRVGLSAS